MHANKLKQKYSQNHAIQNLLRLNLDFKSPLDSSLHHDTSWKSATTYLNPSTRERTFTQDFSSFPEDYRDIAISSKLLAKRKRPRGASRNIKVGSTTYMKQHYSPLIGQNRHHQSKEIVIPRCKTLDFHNTTFATDSKGSLPPFSPSRPLASTTHKVIQLIKASSTKNTDSSQVHHRSALSVKLFATTKRVSALHSRVLSGLDKIIHTPVPKERFGKK